MNDIDFDIIRSVQNGQVKDYETLVNKYQSAIFNVLFQMLQQRETAKELAQDVFVKAYEHLDTFNYRSKFFSWIYRIAINTALSYQKKQQRYVSLEGVPHDVDRPAEDRLVEKESSTLLRAAVNRLKDKYKTVIVLRYFEQLSYAEIAAVLDIPEKMVKSRLFDARQLLRGHLQESNYF